MSSLFKEHQHSKLDKSVCRSLWSSTSIIFLYNLTSSAKSNILENLIVFIISLIKIRKSNGPRCDP